MLFVYFIFTSLNIFAQLTPDTWKNLPTAEQYKKIKKQEVAVKLHTNEKINGVLYNVTAESLILLPKDDYIDRYSHFVKLVKEDQIVLNISSIHKVQTNKGNGGKGFLLGLGIGAVAGFSIGGASSGYEFAAVGAGGIAGGLIGLIVGSITSKSYSPKNKTQMEQLRKKGVVYGY